MYATIRTYAGNPRLADTLAEHEDDIRQVITGINGFKAYYLVKGGDGTTSVSVFDDQAGALKSRLAPQLRGLPKTSRPGAYGTAGVGGRGPHRLLGRPPRQRSRRLTQSCSHTVSCGVRRLRVARG
jgi:hypothetical protein